MSDTKNKELQTTNDNEKLQNNRNVDDQEALWARSLQFFETMNAQPVKQAKM